MDRSVRIPLFHFLTGSRDIEPVFQELGFFSLIFYDLAVQTIVLLAWHTAGALSCITTMHYDCEIFTRCNVSAQSGFPTKF